MPEKKSQHYVPQMYFRNFSENRKSIGGYILSEHKFVRDISIYSICKKDYLYGDDLQIEKWFSKLENKWAQLLSKIIKYQNLQLSDKELVLLFEFVYLSDVRTDYSANASNDEITKICQAAMQLKKEKAGISIDDSQIQKIKMKWNIPIIGALKTLKKALLHFYGLDVLLLVNHTSRPFITSDNPVVKYNYLFATRHYKLNFGYDHSGALVLLPINPILCLLIYDPEAYEISCCDKKSVHIHAPNQIIELNKLIAQNAKSTIFFQNSAREWVVEKYAKGVKDTHDKYNNRIIKSSNGDYFVLASTYSCFSIFRLDFCKIRPNMLDKPFPKNLAGPIRSSIRQLQKNEE